MASDLQQCDGAAPAPTTTPKRRYTPDTVLGAFIKELDALKAAREELDDNYFGLSNDEVARLQQEREEEDKALLKKCVNAAWAGGMIAEREAAKEPARRDVGLEKHISSALAAWNPEEDATLMSSRSYGMDWELMQQRYFPTKTTDACRRRYQLIMDYRGDDVRRAKKRKLDDEIAAMFEKPETQVVHQPPKRPSTLKRPFHSTGFILDDDSDDDSDDDQQLEVQAPEVRADNSSYPDIFSESFQSTLQQQILNSGNLDTSAASVDKSRPFVIPDNANDENDDLSQGFGPENWEVRMPSRDEAVTSASSVRQRFQNQALEMEDYDSDDELFVRQYDKVPREIDPALFGLSNTDEREGGLNPEQVVMPQSLPSPDVQSSLLGITESMIPSDQDQSLSDILRDQCQNHELPDTFLKNAGMSQFSSNKNQTGNELQWINWTASNFIDGNFTDGPPWTNWTASDFANEYYDSSEVPKRIPKTREPSQTANDPTHKPRSAKLSERRPYQAVRSSLVVRQRLPTQEDWDEALALEGVTAATFEKWMAPVRKAIIAEAKKLGKTPDLSFPARTEAEARQKEKNARISVGVKRKGWKAELAKAEVARRAEMYSAMVSPQPVPAATQTPFSRFINATLETIGREYYSMS